MSNVEARLALLERLLARALGRADDATLHDMAKEAEAGGCPDLAETIRRMAFTEAEPDNLISAEVPPCPCGQKTLDDCLYKGPFPPECKVPEEGDCYD